MGQTADSDVMRVGTFYFSVHDGVGRQRIDLPNGGYGYVRVTESVDTFEGALDKAEPAADESVMNTHALSVDDDRRLREEDGE